MNWTPEAKQQLENYFEHRLREENLGGADPADVSVLTPTSFPRFSLFGQNRGSNAQRPGNPTKAARRTELPGRLERDPANRQRDGPMPPSRSLQRPTRSCAW